MQTALRPEWCSTRHLVAPCWGPRTKDSVTPEVPLPRNRSSLAFRQLDLGDFTKGGKDVAGMIVVVSVGTLCGCGAGTLGADALRHPTKASRLIIGACAGGSVAACATGGLSKNNSKLALASLVCGMLAGAVSASFLRTPEGTPTQRSAAPSSQRRTAASAPTPDNSQKSGPLSTNVTPPVQSVKTEGGAAATVGAP